MGDFAAGKLLGPDGVEIAPVKVQDFDQFVNDVDANKEFASSVGHTDPDPAGVDISGMVHIGTDGELLLCLKQWRDDNCSLFVDGTSYKLLLASAIASCEFGEGQAFQIGVDLDDSPLFMTPDGVLLKDDNGTLVELPERTLGAALGMFRTHLLRSKIEWAEGWVETGC